MWSHRASAAEPPGIELSGRCADACTDARELGGRPVPGGEVPGRRPRSPRRWRIFEEEESITILDDQAAVEVHKVPALRVDRATGRAVEERRPVAEVLDGSRGGAPAEGGGWRRSLRAYAILGILSAEDSAALLAVTGAHCVCDVDDKRIYEVVAVEWLPVATECSGAGADAEGVWAARDRVLELLCGGGFYFAQDFDITHTLQWKKRRAIASRQTGAALGPLLPDGSPDLLAAAEPRFVWSRRLAEQLTRQGVSARWLLPLMQGHIQAVHRSRPHPDLPGCELHLTLMLISRRGSERAGTRYNARGLDASGGAANLAETEQLARFHLTRSSDGLGQPLPPVGFPHGWVSLVQLRGSVPLFWEQAPQGPVHLTQGAAQTHAAFERHHCALERAYEGEVFYANLLSAAPAEHVLTEALEEHLRAFCGSSSPGRLGYCHFDFHECVQGGSREEFDAELGRLLREVEPFLQRSGWLDATSDSPGSPPAQPRRWQAGVLRTNCLDCLDRTNVTQFFVAWCWLKGFCQRHPALCALLEAGPPEDDADQGSALLGLARAGASLLDVFGGGSTTCPDKPGQHPVDGRSVDGQPPPLLRQLLQELWADHGDRVSQQYTGTDSVMTSLLRQGRYTSYGLLVERLAGGINRAYQASFQDAQRQEAIDLLLGVHCSSSDLRCLRPAS